MDVGNGRIKFLAIFLVYVLSEHHANGTIEFAVDHVGRIGITMQTFQLYREFYGVKCRNKQTTEGNRSSSEEHEHKFRLEYYDKTRFSRKSLRELKCIKDYAVNVPTETLDPALLFVFLFLKYSALIGTVEMAEGSLRKEGDENYVIHDTFRRLAIELSYFGLELPEKSVISALRRKFYQHGSLTTLDELEYSFDELEKQVHNELKIIENAKETSKRVRVPGEYLYKLDRIFAKLLYGSISYLPMTMMRKVFDNVFDSAEEILTTITDEEDISKTTEILDMLEWRRIYPLARKEYGFMDPVRYGIRNAKLVVAVSFNEGYRPPEFRFELLYMRGTEYKTKQKHHKYRHGSDESKSSKSDSHEEKHEHGNGPIIIVNTESSSEEENGGEVVEREEAEAEMYDPNESFSNEEEEAAEEDF